MRVWFLSSEVAPYAKTGGLGDVAAALPKALAALGHEVHTVTPLHAATTEAGFELAPGPRFSTTFGADTFDWETATDGDVWFLRSGDLFDGPVYGEGTSEGLRYAAFTQAAVALADVVGFAPDVVHANDWPTALAPLYVAPAGPTAVLTIHNLGYQGIFDPAIRDRLGVEPSRLVDDPLGRGVGFLATGLVSADVVTTVSPTYAREIQTPEAGLGLDSILRAREVVGILNGIDTTVWNPRIDPRIPFHYSERSLWRKEWDKRALLERLGLAYRRHVPVVGMVSRLVSQKGIDLLPGPITHFLDTWDVRVVFLGSGDAHYERMLAELVAHRPEHASFQAGYDEDLSHLIEAGADVFLMPSLYEPCGLNQMYSLAYGTAPVVRRVGGLADTVRHFDPDTGEGTGFVFEHYSAEGLGWALGRALDLHTDRRAWTRLQRNAMAEDNSWERRAGEYARVYRRATTRRQR